VPFPLGPALLLDRVGGVSVCGVGPLGAQVELGPAPATLAAVAPSVTLRPIWSGGVLGSVPPSDDARDTTLVIERRA